MAQWLVPDSDPGSVGAVCLICVSDCPAVSKSRGYDIIRVSIVVQFGRFVFPPVGLEAIFSGGNKSKRHLDGNTEMQKNQEFLKMYVKTEEGKRLS